MEVTLDRTTCKQAMQAMADDTLVNRVGVFSIPINPVDIERFNPTDYLHRICTFMRQYFDKVVVSFMTGPMLFPAARANITVPTIPTLTSTGVESVLEPLIGDVCDHVNFDTITLPEARAVYDHLSTPEMLTAARAWGTCLRAIPCLVRHANTYDALTRAGKFYMVCPKNDLVFTSMNWMMSNLIQQAGQTLVMPQTPYYEDYGKIVVAPYARNTDETPGNLVGIPPQGRDILLTMRDQIDEITLADLQTMDMRDVLRRIDNAVDNMNCGWDWTFLDFERAQPVRSYIPRNGALKLRFSWYLGGTETSISDYHFIGNNKNRFWDVRREQDFTGMPTGPSDIDSFTRQITDSAIWSQLPTERTTGPTSPIRTF